MNEHQNNMVQADPPKRKPALIILVLIVVLGLIALVSMPVTRIVSYTLNVKSSPMVVYRELSMPANYSAWYTDSSATPKEFRLQEYPDSMKIHFTVLHKERKESSGLFSVHAGMDGTSYIQNHETLQVRSLVDKIKFFISPASFKTFYNKKVDRLRSFLEDTRWESAGVRFSPTLMPHHYIVAYGDSIRPGTEDIQIVQFYKKISETVPGDKLENIERPESRIKITAGKLPYFQVGIQLKDSSFKVPSPLVKLEVPECKIILGAVKGNYSGIEGSLEIMRDWIKKNHLITATHPWIEHKVITSQDQVLLTDSLYIIQPVYFYPKK